MIKFLLRYSLFLFSIILLYDVTNYFMSKGDKNREILVVRRELEAPRKLHTITKPELAGRSVPDYSPYWVVGGAAVAASGVLLVCYLKLRRCKSEWGRKTAALVKATKEGGREVEQARFYLFKQVAQAQREGGPDFGPAKPAGKSPEDFDLTDLYEDVFSQNSIDVLFLSPREVNLTSIKRDVIQQNNLPDVQKTEIVKKVLENQQCKFEEIWRSDVNVAESLRQEEKVAEPLHLNKKEAESLRQDEKVTDALHQGVNVRDTLHQDKSVVELIHQDKSRTGPLHQGKSVAKTIHQAKSVLESVRQAKSAAESMHQDKNVLERISQEKSVMEYLNPDKSRMESIHKDKSVRKFLLDKSVVESLHQGKSVIESLLKDKSFRISLPQDKNDRKYLHLDKNLQECLDEGKNVLKPFQDKSVDECLFKDKIVVESVQEDKSVQKSSNQDKSVVESPYQGRSVKKSLQDKGVGKTLQDRYVRKSEQHDKNVGESLHYDKNVVESVHQHKNVGESVHQDKNVGECLHQDKNVGESVLQDKKVGESLHQDKSVGESLHQDKKIGKPQCNDLTESLVQHESVTESLLHENIREGLHQGESLPQEANIPTSNVLNDQSCQNIQKSCECSEKILSLEKEQCNESSQTENLAEEVSQKIDCLQTNMNEGFQNLKCEGEKLDGKLEKLDVKLQCVEVRLQKLEDSSQRSEQKMDLAESELTILHEQMFALLSQVEKKKMEKYMMMPSLPPETPMLDKDAVLDLEARLSKYVPQARHQYQDRAWYNSMENSGYVEVKGHHQIRNSGDRACLNANTDNKGILEYKVSTMEEKYRTLWNREVPLIPTQQEVPGEEERRSVGPRRSQGSLPASRRSRVTEEAVFQFQERLAVEELRADEGRHQAEVVRQQAEVARQQAEMARQQAEVERQQQIADLREELIQRKFQVTRPNILEGGMWNIPENSEGQYESLFISQKREKETEEVTSDKNKNKSSTKKEEKVEKFSETQCVPTKCHSPIKSKSIALEAFINDDSKPRDPKSPRKVKYVVPSHILPPYKKAAFTATDPVVDMRKAAQRLRKGGEGRFR